MVAETDEDKNNILVTYKGEKDRIVVEAAKNDYDEFNEK